MSLYSEFLPDSKEILSDFGISATVGAGSYLVMVSDPTVNPTLEAGGFVERLSWTVRFAAATGSWTASDGRVGGSAATLSTGAPVSALNVGKKLTVNGKAVRITAQSYKAGSSWITLTVVDDAE